MPTDQQLQTLQQQIAPAAIHCESLTGIPAEVTAAQVILETGWLVYAPGNNCLGIKSYPGEYGRQLLTTREWFTDAEKEAFLLRGDSRAVMSDPQRNGAMVNGRRAYLVKDWFASFATLGDCFAYRANLLLTNPLYRAALEAYRAGLSPGSAETQAIADFIDAISRHYATDRGYADKIKDLAFSQAVTDALNAARAA